MERRLSLGVADCSARAENAPDRSVRMVVGYAGWAPGQLDVELARGSWLLAPVQSDLIFETPVDAMWEAAIRRLGRRTVNAARFVGRALGTGIRDQGSGIRVSGIRNQL